MVDRRPIPLADPGGRPFTYRLPPSALRVLHLADKHLGGTITSAFPQLVTDDDQKRYLLTSLREEAISSSLIEGAVATREQAKEMIRKNRPPRTAGERMIVNNYRAIRMVNERCQDPLTPELLFEIQRCLTDGTLAAEAAGRFRRPDEDITVWDDEEQVPLHVPPPAGELADRARRMCDFANDGGAAKPGEFIHPVVRAVLLHFWLAYDHPFVDGNGRTARALFYWSMLRDGYYLAEYLTISTVINAAPKVYARAYLNTEHDDNDLTYFLLYHLGVVDRSVVAFREYLDRKTREQQGAVLLLTGPFNPRQRAAVLLALKNPAAVFTYTSHANSHGVVLATARTDLQELERHGLFTSRRVGRQFEFTPAPGLEARLRRLAARP